MTVTLVTGSTRGLGRETARRLVLAGHSVYLSGRNPASVEEAAAAVGASPLVLDVCDDASVEAAAATLAEATDHLDVLVNNAGVPGPPPDTAGTTAAVMRDVFETNVFGPVRTLHAFASLLDASPAPVVVNVSSSLGSLTRSSDPSSGESTFPMPSYPSSKAALNMVTVYWAKSYPRWRVNSVDPGWTRTDFTGNQGPQSVEEGAEGIVAMALIGADGPTGTFVSTTGETPW